MTSLIAFGVQLRQFFHHGEAHSDMSESIAPAANEPDNEESLCLPTTLL